MQAQQGLKTKQNICGIGLLYVCAIVGQFSHLFKANLPVPRPPAGGGGPVHCVVRTSGFNLNLIRKS